MEIAREELLRVARGLISVFFLCFDWIGVLFYCTSVSVEMQTGCLAYTTESVFVLFNYLSVGC